MTRTSVWIGGVLIAVLGVACGGEEPLESRTARPMGAAAQRSDEAGSAAAAEPDWLSEALGEPVLEEPVPASAGNRPPRVRSLEIRPTRNLAGQDVWARANVEDPDGDEVSVVYSWLVNGSETQAEGNVFPSASLQRGDTLQLRVVASDGRSESEPVESPLLEVENGPPRILSQPQPPGPDGRFRYQVRAEDPEGQGGLRYQLAEAPAGMSVSRLGGLVEWSPRLDQSGTHAVDIAVEDSEGAVTHQRFELSVAPPGDASPAAPAR